MTSAACAMDAGFEPSMITLKPHLRSVFCNAQNRGSFGRRGLDGLNRRTRQRQMAHLAAFFGVFFAVQVQMRARQSQNLSHGGVWFACTVRKPHIPQNIQHDGRAVLARLGQRQAAQGAHLQLKLRHIAGVDGVVAAVVRARGDLVHHQAIVVQQEQLDAQHTDILQLICYRYRSSYSTFYAGWRQISFINRGGRQNAVDMHIQLRREVDDLPVATASQDHGVLGLSGSIFSSTQVTPQWPTQPPVRQAC